MNAILTKISNATNVESRADGDTLRLWESYRDQALLWRSLSLLQIPITILALVLTVLVFNNRSVTLNVPARPLPGVYELKELPDPVFVEAATQFINLIATYQPSTAQPQFAYARRMTFEPYLSRFDKEMMELEVRTIQSTNRTQIFFMDPSATTVQRGPDGIQVTLIGERSKVVSGQFLPSRRSKYVLSLNTIPQSDLNPYGIVVTNVIAEDISER